jgi:chemotaxis protein CheC
LGALEDLQLDALREVGNIGAGTAATALSQMIGEPVGMSVPRVRVLPLEAAASAAPRPSSPRCTCG